MQNIITLEVEQRTKAWISQQPESNSNSTAGGSSSTKTQVTVLENENN